MSIKLKTGSAVLEKCKKHTILVVIVDDDGNWDFPSLDKKSRIPKNMYKDWSKKSRRCMLGLIQEVDLSSNLNVTVASCINSLTKELIYSALKTCLMLVAHNAIPKESEVRIQINKKLFSEEDITTIRLACEAELEDVGIDTALYF